jgi:hypothetical protein
MPPMNGPRRVRTSVRHWMGGVCRAAAAVGGGTPGHPQRPRGADAAAHIQTPVPVVARIEWAMDGVEQLETEALGWAGRNVYVRVTDTRTRGRRSVLAPNGRLLHTPAPPLPHDTMAARTCDGCGPFPRRLWIQPPRLYTVVKYHVEERGRPLPDRPNNLRPVAKQAGTRVGT